MPPHDIHSSIETITELFMDKKTNRVMLDTAELEKVPNVWKLYEISKKIPHGLRIAVITGKDRLHSRNLNFFETTSRNKGKAVKVFRSLIEAEKWLTN